MNFLSYLIFCITSLLATVVSSEEWIECQSDNFAVETENNQIWTVYEASINISYNRNDLAVYDYSGVKNVNILLRNIAVSFLANDILKRTNTNFNENAIFGNLNTTIIGAAEMMTVDNVGSMLMNCDLYLTKSYNESDDVPKQIQVQIMDEAATCLRAQLCKRIGTITTDDLSNASNYPFEFGPLSVEEDSRENYVATSDNSACNINVGERQYTTVDKTQDTINTLVDLAMTKMAKKMREKNEGRIKISNMNTTFSFLGNTLFKAVNGTFEDITVFFRKNDVSLLNDGDKFFLSCSFGFDKGYIYYEKYELEHGLFGLYEGELNATVRDVALTAAVELDYAVKPCRAVLRELRVTELGEVEIALTGLGGLSGMLSSIASWSTAFFREEISRALEAKFKKFIGRKLSQYDCEKLH